MINFDNVIWYGIAKNLKSNFHCINLLQCIVLFLECHINWNCLWGWYSLLWSLKNVKPFALGLKTYHLVWSNCAGRDIVHPWEKSSWTLFCTCQIFKLSFRDCYKNLAFCNMKCIKQFIIFLVLIRYASVGIKGEPESKKCDVHFVKWLGTTHPKLSG